MDARAFIQNHWKLYLSLEKDLMDIAEYISFSTENDSTFSTKLLKSLLAIGAEFDVVSKSYCVYLGNREEKTYKYSDILDYSFCFQSERPSITHEIVQLEIVDNYFLSPLDTWKCDLNKPRNQETNCAPEWWWAYNKSKHERNVCCIEPSPEKGLKSLSEKTHMPKYYGKLFFQTANLRNVLNALASLFIVEMYFYKDLATDANTDVTVPEEYSKLFYLLDWETHILSMSRVISVNSQLKFAHRTSKNDLTIEEE